MNKEQGEDELVDYNEDDDEDDIRRNEEDKTTRAKIYADNHTEVEAHDLAVAERDDKSGDKSIDQGASQEDEKQDGTRLFSEVSLNNPVVKPVLTQKGLMDIIAKQPQALMQKMEWEQKKQCYKEMLSGYESPNGTSMSVGVELMALMFVSAVSASAQMISHLAQSEASDKLMKQTEQHREALEKEFKQNMERMKAEHDRVINEAMKISDNYARSALEAASAVNQTIQKIDQLQSDKVVDFQLETLKKRALKFEQQLVEATEKHEEELKEKELLCNKQKKELLKERKRKKELEEELLAYEDCVINGTALPKEMMLRKSPDSCPEVPNPKRARVDLIEDTSPALNQMNKALNKWRIKPRLLKRSPSRKEHTSSG
jgi:hypothetical protein